MGLGDNTPLRLWCNQGLEGGGEHPALPQALEGNAHDNIACEGVQMQAGDLQTAKLTLVRSEAHRWSQDPVFRVTKPRAAEGCQLPPSRLKC